MRLKLLAGLVVSCALFSTHAARAWNATGHETIAAIAWNHLTPAAKAKVTTLLKQHPDYTHILIHETTPEGEARDREAFIVAATWPDVIRSSRLKSHSLSHPNWHFIDIPFVLGNVKPEAPSPIMIWKPGQEPANAVQALKKNAADLRDTAHSPADRAIALAWVEHLIGDIHQPLHATSLFSPQFPAGDKGGNSDIIKADGRIQNLHSLWDAMAGGYMDLGSVEEMAKRIEDQHPPREFAKDLADPNADDWARESYEQAVKVVYLDGRLKAVTHEQQKAHVQVPELPEGYLQNSRAAAERYVALAGYRLADALNSMLK